MIVAGVLVHRYAVALPLDLPLGVRIGSASVAGVLGLVLMGGAVVRFRRTGQDPKPWTPTPEIVAAGVYRLTRNPMYLGMAMIQAALGIGLGNGWILVLVPALVAIVHVTAVRHEESYLTRKFGERYTRYKAAVRRWI